MNNRIIDLFAQKNNRILNIYFTAGYPQLHDTVSIVKSLEEAGADMIEIGIPFSDPIADGPTIQASNQVALDNGISLEVLFQQLEGIRENVNIPIILMGYLNPVVQYGIENFCKKAAELGVDGIILPDLPMREFEMVYKDVFERHNLSHIFLVTPQTSDDRIRKIDQLSSGFIYVVSMDSTTGRTDALSDKQKAYFERIQSMKLANPALIGFGISDHKSFETASEYAQGAIIGSAFIKAISNGKPLKESVEKFVKSIK